MSKSFESRRQASVVKRAGNRDNSAAILSHAGIKFDSRNGGAHLVVYHNGFTFDFWPGTGKWCQRGAADYAGINAVD